ncbi:MAG: hypothetical protein CVV61_04775 [Tenericutes bacterium HGW-Tenericutes-6]|jgi:hypothetical protein|nr:MAG: hypothetical protein CVV61_04775 [Tenericutes bacterium HGW-Tenericutes-6]
MKRLLRMHYIKQATIVIFIIVVLYVTEIFKANTLESFELRKAYVIDFVRFSLIGALISLPYARIYDKNTWILNFKLDRIVMPIFYLIISMALILPISFIVTPLLKLNIPVSIGILPFQILFGYSLMHLFIKD